MFTDWGQTYLFLTLSEVSSCIARSWFLKHVLFFPLENKNQAGSITRNLPVPIFSLLFLLSGEDRMPDCLPRDPSKAYVMSACPSCGVANDFKPLARFSLNLV